MATALDQAALDLASSLTPAEIPIKLRCAACDKLVVNAWKLPCCDQSVCENCQASLSDTCPVCSHSPLDGTTCKQNKPLRMTVRAFLKAEEKKRSKETGEAVSIAPPTPASQEPSQISGAPAAPQVQVTPTEQEPSVPAQPDQQIQDQQNDPSGEELPIPSGIVPSVEQPLENVTQQYEPADGEVDAQNEANAEDDAQSTDSDSVVIRTEAEELPIEEGQEQQGFSGDQQEGQNHSQKQNGFDGQDAQQGVSGMDWNASNGFNPMMMANNMGGFGFPNMMGMAGMGMNPMMSQNMFGGFGQMGMGNMGGMGMGFGGFGGGWNGQQGMGGNFGGNAGFYPGSGYNAQSHPGSYDQQMQHQFPNHPNQNRFANRGYGRGRGYGGRGGHFYQNQAQNHMAGGQYGAAQAGSDAYPQELPAELQERRPSQQTVASETPQQGLQNATSVDGSHADVSAQRDVNADGDGDAQALTTDEQIPQPDAEQAHDATNDVNMGQYEEGQQEGLSAVGEQNAEDQYQNGTMDMTMSQDPMLPGAGMVGQNMYQPDMTAYGHMNGMGLEGGMYGAPHYQRPFGGRGRGGFGRGSFHGRGGYGHVPGGFGGPQGNMSQPENFTVLVGADAGPPIDAPKGPKAMREGLPNNGIYSRPGALKPTPQPQQTSVEPEAAQPVAEEVQERGRSKSRSRSASRDRKRKYDDQSTTASRYESEADERRRERRRRHESKYEDEKYDYSRDDRDSKNDRSRSRTPDDDSERRRRRREKEKQRASRSHREYSKDRGRRHRHRSKSPANDEYSRGDDYSEGGHRKSRSHRDKDRERERDRAKEKDRKRSRRDRTASPDVYEKEREHHSSSRRDRHSKDSRSDRDRNRTRDREHDRDPANPADDDIGFKIKGSRNAASKSTPSTTTFAPPTGPKTDRERSRRPSVHSHDATPAPTTTTALDPYAQEREARTRERVLKEQQRRESATLGKRGRGSTSFDMESARLSGDRGFDPPTGPKAEKGSMGRRRGEQNGSSKRSRVGYGDDEEERADRVEREREAGRWG